MKNLTIKEIEKLREIDSNELHYLFYNKDGNLTHKDGEVSFVIERGGFISSMDGNFYATHIVPFGYVSSYKQSTINGILDHLRNYRYVPDHDNWRKRKLY